MWYACDKCGHRERMWNSRDGVTPFGTQCPSCGKPSLQHTDFHLDQYAPDHTPAMGQRIWIAMSRRRAEFITSLRIKAAQARGPLTVTAEHFKQTVEHIWEQGATPDMMVVGYSEPTAIEQLDTLTPAAMVESRAQDLTDLAASLKMNVTIERRPVPGRPLAMGNGEAVISVWPTRVSA